MNQENVAVVCSLSVVDFILRERENVYKYIDRNDDSMRIHIYVKHTRKRKRNKCFSLTFLCRIFSFEVRFFVFLIFFFF